MKGQKGRCNRCNRLAIAFGAAALSAVGFLRLFLSRSSMADTRVWRRLPLLKTSDSALSGASATAVYPGHEVPGRPRFESAAGSVDAEAGKGVQTDGLRDLPRTADDIHVIFMTDCTPAQTWQSLLLILSARASGQKGRITRIASGCSAEEAEALQELHGTLSPLDGLHLAPASELLKPDGSAFPGNNKPDALVHFLEHAVPAVSETIVALLDVDTVVLRPLTPYLGQGVEIFLPNHPHIQVRGRDAQWVTRAHPVAQGSGGSGEWANWPELRAIVPPDSHLFALDPEEAARFYVAGPPYLAHVSDWLRLAEKWAHFTPALLQVKQELAQSGTAQEQEAVERQAWSLAVVEAGLPHTLVSSLAASDPGSVGYESWHVVDELPLERACMGVDEFRLRHGNIDKNYTARPIPATLHYSQVYRQEDFLFSKQHAGLENIFRCDGPLLEEPVVVKAAESTQIMADPLMDALSERETKRETFALCLATKALNDALRYYRERNCLLDASPPAVIRLADSGLTASA